MAVLHFLKFHGHQYIRVADVVQYAHEYGEDLEAAGIAHGAKAMRNFYAALMESDLKAPFNAHEC